MAAAVMITMDISVQNVHILVHPDITNQPHLVEKVTPTNQLLQQRKQDVLLELVVNV